MEFSSSFEFGNSTFMKLESQANHAIENDQENRSPGNKLDVILESPTKSSNRTSGLLYATKSRSRFLQNTTQHSKNPKTGSDTRQHRKFRRSKSDSTLPKPPKNETCENYSEFFRSDFSLADGDHKNNLVNQEKESLFMRVSQIEEAFNGIDAVLKNNMEVQEELFECDFSFNPESTNNIEHAPQATSRAKMDAVFNEQNATEHEINGETNPISMDNPIFSEDLKGIVDTEDDNGNDELWQDTLPLSAIPPIENNKEFEEPLIVHEVSSFLCHPQEKNSKFNIKDVITKELEISRRVLRECEATQSNTTLGNISLSHMSPDQLKFTQESPDSNEKKSTEIKIHKRPSNSRQMINAETVATNAIKSKEKMQQLDNVEVLKSISAWNLPLSILKEYERKGIKKMFDWQVECLSNPKVLFEHCNLVYSAPTSAGKTLVSEILLLKTVLERFKKVLLILPFISVVREKMFYLQDLLTAAGYRVEGFFGGYTPPGGFDSIDVAICTIEKANSIVNKLLEQGRLDQIGTVVVDEVHLISDPGRGYILELLLAKILYMSRKYALQIQVITMSATLANVELLKKWLDAELYITHFRPVALQEMVKVGNKIYDNELQVLRSITEPSVDIREPFPVIQNDSDHVAQLCIETLIEGCSVIVFCPSKDWCENLSVQLAGVIHTLGKQGGEWGVKLRAQLNREGIDEMKQQLKDIPTGLDAVLEKTVTYGCAFHHAGLTTEERDIVEASFKSGTLRIIVATSTLSSGVNLPARRVLIRSPLFGGKIMSSLTYRQMIGRAGRTGKDTMGESILICTESNARLGKELVRADLKPISSCLEMDNSTHLKRALLEVISSGVATSKHDIDMFVNCTLLSAQKLLVAHERKDGAYDTMEDECIGSALQFLLEYEFVRLQTNEETNEQYYVATRLGMACLASSMPPTDGLILFAELQKSRRCFVLESELHAVYLVTPYSVCYQLQDLDWLFFLDLWEKLTPAMKKVGELVGVKESFLVRAMRGQTKLDYKLLQIHKRFYTALALQELVNETPINVVATKYKCPRGMLQSLQQMASTFAGIVTSFCNSLQWDTLTLIVSQFKERLYFGVHRDLIDLMRIPDLNHKRARALFDAGVTSLVDLANADIFKVEKILHDALSFDSAKQHDNENEVEAAQRNEVRNFYITGKAGITIAEAAKLIVYEARQFVQYEIGAGNINWSQPNGNEVKSDEKSECKLHMSYEEDKFNHIELNKENAVEVVVSSSSKKIAGNEIYNEVVGKTLNTSLQSPEKSHTKIDDANLKPEVGIVNYSKVNILRSSSEFSISGTNGNKKNIENEPAKCLENRQVVLKKSVPVKVDCKTNIAFDDDSKLSDAAQQNSPSDLKKRRKVELTDVIGKEKCISTEQPIQINEDTPPQGKRANCNEIGNEEKPSTSKKAQRLLRAKQLSEIKKQEWAKKQRLEQKNMHNVADSVKTYQKDIKEKRTPSQNVVEKVYNSEGNKNQKEFHNKDQTDTPIKKDLSKIEGNPALMPNSKSKGVNSKGPDQNSPNTPRSSHYSHKPQLTNTNDPIKLPRRSPRNHLISSTRIEHKSVSNSITPPTKKSVSHKTCSKSPIELFSAENEGSFVFNTDINRALKEAEVPYSKDHLNKSQEEEIPSSQQLIDDVGENKTNSPHASKFLRSLRSTQRLQSPRNTTPKRSLKSTKSPPQNIQITSKTQFTEPSKHMAQEQRSSTSIEMSDFSMENSLIKNPMLLNASHILSCSKVETESSSFQSIDIIDICGDQQLFKGAFKEFMSNKRLGFCLGIQQKTAKRRPIIGANLLLNQVAAAEKENDSNNYDFQIDDINYLAGVAFCISENLIYYMNMQTPGSCKGLTAEIKSKYLRMLLRSSEHCLLTYDAREQLKVLRKLLNDLGEILISIEDPKVANWLLQPDKIHNLHSLAQQFAPECSALVNLCGSGRGYQSYGLDSDSAILAKVRCSIESCVSVHILKGQIENLERIGTGQLYKFFKELEMPLQISLCNMEDFGFPTNSEALHKLFQQMVEATKKLESKIYELHGSRFNLGSSSAVARVLGLHRKSNGRISTSKQILEKIDTPISQMIITYRKLSVTLTKNIQPLLKCVRDERIHGQSITFTSTGRISMVEPNLQNVAKDFDVETPSDKFTISCRSAFYPSEPRRCLISSDFCQLEMRILAHLSQDSALIKVMNSEKDVFVAIAARWNKLSEQKVTEQLRNGTKQICYGIVYGMGIRALAESLKCTEEEAKFVSEQFHTAYPGIRSYIEKVIKFARNNGYIETITGRRRYLEHINSGETLMRTQAERQAVNSTIQGSAADIAKSAILRMEKNVTKYRDKLGIEPQSVRLVLHLHDELIFEVPEEKAKKIAKVLSITMENCVRLNVPLKVKLKIGKSWGELKEVKL